MVAIGVTGHRVLAERERVEAGVDEALRRIAERFPRQPVTVVSSLAEGADRLVVRRAMARPGGARLVVPLPLPAADYEADFGSEESKAEFHALLERADEVVELPRAPTRTAAYAAAGEYVLRRADALLAVWDGRPAQGEAGTGAIVALARARGLPIARVHAGNRRPGTLEPTTLGAAQGTVTYEGL
jgi:hypothetical protein